jgi:uncharacterized protein
MRSIVVIVAKEPVPACVKTRLCTHLTTTEAAELYTLFIQDVVEEMSALSRPPRAATAGSTVAVAYTPEGSGAVFKALLPVDVPLFPQQGNDLGERLSDIFRKLFAIGYDQVHIINSDSPDMPCALVSRAIQLLEDPGIDLVLGPCPDGGYYLIGLKGHFPQLFNHIPWSTEKVLKMTLQCARKLGLSFALLEPWHDVDHYDDLLLFLERHRGRTNDAHEAGWRTLKYLRRRMQGKISAGPCSYSYVYSSSYSKK